MVERVFPSNASALSWAAWFVRTVAREVALANIDGEKWLRCEPEAVYFEEEDFYNHRPLYVSYRSDRLDWANVIADAARKALEDDAMVIRSDYRQDYGDGSYEISIVTEAVKVDISHA